MAAKVPSSKKSGMDPPNPDQNPYQVPDSSFVPVNVRNQWKINITPLLV
jgi:hypothetical protein